MAGEGEHLKTSTRRRHQDEVELANLEARFASGDLSVGAFQSELAALLASRDGGDGANPKKETFIVGSGMQPIIVTLQRGKETPGTHRFEGPDAAPITTVYVKKSAFLEGKVPTAIRVTVEAIE